jgi:hypothetical protein
MNFLFLIIRNKTRGGLFAVPFCFALVHHASRRQSDAPDESAALRLRLNELNGALMDLVAASTSGWVDNTADDDGCNGIEAEILSLQARLAEIEGSPKEAESKPERLEEIFAMLEKMRNHLVKYDEKTVQQLLECVKVIDRENLLVIFRGGIEREVRMA